MQRGIAVPEDHHRISSLQPLGHLTCRDNSRTALCEALAVQDTPIARIGGLICWENMMPLARYAVYRGGPQIYVAPTADDSESWLGSMRHIAYEAGAFVVSVPNRTVITAVDRDHMREHVFTNIDSAVIA